jgi:integrase/recombinase XerD
MIRHFYAYKMEQGKAEINPVTGIKVQGVKRKSLYYIFKPEELHTIYNACPDSTPLQQQDKVMLGLLVYQGLKVEDINRLEVAHVKLKEGKLEVPGSRKTNPRTLTLESFQVLELYDYVIQVRKELIKQSGEQTEKLFVGVVGTANMNNQVGRLIRQLREKFKALKNAKQIRASVITKWLKFHNLRQVQYLAGHRYISSTESYQQNEMEGLTEEVNRFHPLG